MATSFRTIGRFTPISGSCLVLVIFQPLYAIGSHARIRLGERQNLKWRGGMIAQLTGGKIQSFSKGPCRNITIIPNVKDWRTGTKNCRTTWTYGYKSKVSVVQILIRSGKRITHPEKQKRTSESHHTLRLEEFVK